MRRLTAGEAGRCACCGGVLTFGSAHVQPSSEDELVEVSLSDRYPPMVARLLTEIIDRNPPPDNVLEFDPTGRYIQWTDASGTVHQLDTHVESGFVEDEDDDDDDREEETPTDAVSVDQLAAALARAHRPGDA